MSPCCQSAIRSQVHVICNLIIAGNNWGCASRLLPPIILRGKTCKWIWLLPSGPQIRLYPYSQIVWVSRGVRGGLMALRAKPTTILGTKPAVRFAAKPWVSVVAFGWLCISEMQNWISKLQEYQVEGATLLLAGC